MKKILSVEIAEDEFVNVIRKTFREELERFSSLTKQNDDSVLLSRKETGELLGVSPNTISKFIEKGLPAYRMQGQIRIDRQDALTFLKKIKRNF